MRPAPETVPSTRTPLRPTRAFALARQVETGRDARIARQLEDAVTSIPLNIAEATGRFGRDRTYHFRVALGSLREVSAALEVGQALGWITELPMTAERDRLGGLLWGLQRR